MFYFAVAGGQPFQVGQVDRVGTENAAADLIDPPIPLMPLRVEVGIQSRASGRAKRVGWRTWLFGTWWMQGWERVEDVAIEAREAVTVPAGTFEAFRVSRRLTFGSGAVITTDEWRAHRVGAVRFVRRHPDGAQEVIELVRWTKP